MPIRSCGSPDRFDAGCWHICIRLAAIRTFCTAGKKQPDEDGDDRDDDEQLDERETTVVTHSLPFSCWDSLYPNGNNA